MVELTLTAHEVHRASRWRWVLTGPDGAVLAEHPVLLDEECWQYEAFGDPHAYLGWRVVPDRRVDHEAEIVAQLGEWVGAEVLGPVGPALLAAGPATVRVVVPAEPGAPRFLPLELAHVGGAPVSLQDITFVHCGTDSAQSATATGNRLRVLGLFSVPDGERPLNLRGERETFSRLFQDLAHKYESAIDVRVLQYGVTRDRLRDLLARSGGWDLVHISGHGAPGELLLETEDGRPDRIAASELAELLEVARDRLKLVSVSACWSAGAGLPAQPAETGSRETGGLATELTDRLGCAVLAMRYPVTDSFAIGLAERLYWRLVGEGLPLPQALAAALSATVAIPATRACPALSVATPALFGAGAAELRLVAPPRTRDAADAPGPVALPAQPQRFVGRVAVLARASAALAPRSGATGVLFHGMPGVGKSACALELAHTHAHAFDEIVWFDAAAGDADRFVDHLPRLGSARRLLIGIDNAESMLTSTGAWRDPRWAMLVANLSGNTGPSRLVVSSRRVPDGLDHRIRREVVNPLILDEALLLAGEFPRLNDLIHGRLPDVARDLGNDVLEVAAGHPAMLEAADEQATDPDRLAQLVATGGGELAEVLRAWARDTVAGLDAAARAMFFSLCCTEKSDRIGPVVDGTWPQLRRGLRVAEDGPTAEEVLAVLVARGLVTVLRPASGAVEYMIHPAVAEAGRDDAGGTAQAVVDDALWGYWLDVYADAQKQETTGSATALVTLAALGVAPYLLRLGRLPAAVGFLEQALHRDDSPATLSRALPLLRRIIAATAGTDEEAGALVALAKALDRVDPAAAEQHMRRAFDLAMAVRDLPAALAAVNKLIHYRRRAGRLAEALDLTERQLELDREAGSGAWTRLMHEGNRLQLLLDMGQTEEALGKATRLLESLRDLPERTERGEGVHPWAVRELLFDTAAGAAHQLNRFQLALDFNNRAIAAKRERGAAPADLAQALYNNSLVLRRLGHLDEAVGLLRECRMIFEKVRDIDRLGTVLNALATVESHRGHGDVAISLQRDALRYQYLTGRIAGIAVTHHCLGTDLGRYAGDRAGAAAHHLAAALLSSFAGGVTEEVSMTDLADDLRDAQDDAVLPTDVRTLCRRVDAVPGVDFGGLLARCATPEEIQRALEDVTARARAAAARPESFAAILAMAEPLTAGIVAARNGDTDAAGYIDSYLSAATEGSTLDGRFAALRRIRQGDHDPDTSGLDEVDGAIVARALDAVAGRAEIEVNLWPAVSLGPLMGHVVKAMAFDSGRSAATARELIAEHLTEPTDAALATTLDEILGGNLDPSLAGLDDPTDRAIVATILRYIDGRRR